MARLEQRIIEVAKYVITAKNETNRITGRIDKSYVEVPEYKYDHATRLAAAKALNEKTGSFKGWADDAKADLNGQLKKQVEEAMNIAHSRIQSVAAFAAVARMVSAAAGTFATAAAAPPNPARRPAALRRNNKAPLPRLIQ